MVVVSSHSGESFKLDTAGKVKGAGLLCRSRSQSLLVSRHAVLLVAEPRVLNKKEEHRVRQVFEKIDKDGSGHIDMSEVYLMLVQLHPRLMLRAVLSVLRLLYDYHD